MSPSPVSGCQHMQAAKRNFDAITASQPRAREHMRIDEAFNKVSDEFDEEATEARKTKWMNEAMRAVLFQEYEELDKVLPKLVAEITGSFDQKLQGTILPEYVYQACRMCFRMGMRTQRKIDQPDKKTSIFWRNE